MNVHERPLLVGRRMGHIWQLRTEEEVANPPFSEEQSNGG
jgi:hypothetical protein